ncbi:MAG: NAD(P)/FAD-dependent oxidoreductase [Gemmatimonadota bacterium]
MREFEYLIVGGGLAAASAVDGIREVDPHGSIGILSDESEPPYHRPPLSKEFVQTPEAPRSLVHVKPEGWFEGREGVELRLGAHATSLDARERQVNVADHEPVRGRRILLATGGRPRTLVLPGRELERVFTLRTVEDSEAIRAAAAATERAVLIGGGFIGMELGASLTKLGVEAVVVECAERVWSSMFPPAVAGFVQGRFEAEGVSFRLGARVERLEGEGQVERAILEDGETIRCDLVVIGVGMIPNDELAVRGGLAVRDGVIVDAFAETTAGHIYAAGDVARFPDPVFDDLTRVEHWDHAKAHGKLAGRNMAGERQPYDHVSYFFTNVFDLSINAFGRPDAAERTIVSGELGPGRSIVYCADEARLCGALLVNANDALDECRELVRARPTVDELIERFENPDAQIGELVG